MTRLNPQIEFILALIILVTTGCASKNPYHTVNWTPGNCVDPSEKPEKPDNPCSQSYYQQYTDYDLAFAEFTERGNAFNSNWIDNVIEKVRAHASDKGVVVVTFIHGWKHNAEETDRNLQDFKKSLESIAKMKPSSLFGRRLVGVYVGWRGASLDLPWIENLTFWDRKTVAEEVGNGGVTKLLLELDRVDKVKSKNTEVDENVLVIVGHSFGGAIVISATTEVLTEGAINRSKTGVLGTAVGDAVIVLNPAIEANQSLSLVEAAIRNDYPDSQNPLFISISSDADSATHYTFPIGQTLGLLLTWHQLDLKRPYYRDRLSKEHLVLKEEHLDATTVGNFAPYLTHRLTIEPKGEEQTQTMILRSCDEVPDQCAPEGLTTLSGHPTIGPLPDNYPLYFIKTDESVIESHNDIFNSDVRAFILTIIDDVVRRTHILEKGGAAPAPPILSSPEVLNRRFQEFTSGK